LTTISQAIPIWVTSVTVPLIAVLLHIGQGSSKDLAHVYLSHFGEPNVLLMLGGFTLGRALQKLQIDRLLAGKVLSRAGSNPFHFLAAVMAACFLLSMALNNVVAPVLMIMVVPFFFLFLILNSDLHSMLDLVSAGSAAFNPRW
jgi:di/tricarboxylate transporter